MEPILKEIYIGNIPHNTSEEDIKTLFCEFGEVNSVALIINRETGKSRGFGFVTMMDDSYADEAISKLEGRELLGKVLHVNEARPLNPPPPRDTW